jgi:hypothetical protein
MFATPSSFAISARLSGLLLYREVDVREMTFKSPILASRVRNFFLDAFSEISVIWIAA